MFRIPKLNIRDSLSNEVSTGSSRQFLCHKLRIRPYRIKGTPVRKGLRLSIRARPKFGRHRPGNPARHQLTSQLAALVAAPVAINWAAARPETALPPSAGCRHQGRRSGRHLRNKSSNAAFARASSAPSRGTYAPTFGLKWSQKFASSFFAPLPQWVPCSVLHNSHRTRRTIYKHGVLRCTPCKHRAGAAAN